MNENASPADDFSELRSRAEESLKKSQLENMNRSSSPEEMLRLFNELAVHQIELEIQQHELIESREELEKSLERYTDLYDFAPLGYLTLAPDSEIVELNLTAATILDVSRSRLRGKRLKNFIVPSDRTTFSALLERVFSHKEPNYCEVELSVCDKNTRSQKTVRIEALLSDNEVSCRAMLSDISIQKKMAQAMRVTNERQQLIIDATHSGSWEWDLQTNRTIWSDEIWRLNGLEPFSCEATYEVWKNSILDDDRDRVEQVVLNAVKCGEEFTVEWRVQTRLSGQQRWVMSKGTPFKDADGLVNRYIGIIIDITDLKIAQEIGKQEQDLSKTIINSIPGTFYIINAEGYYAGWNTFQKDEIIGKGESEIRHVQAISTIHPDDREHVQKKIMGVLEYGLEEEFEGRVLLHGGPEFRWFLMTGRRIIIDGMPFLIGIGIDITERNKIDAIQLFLSSSSYLVQGEPFFNALSRYIAECLNMDFVCIDSLDKNGLTAKTLALWHDDHFEDNVEYTLKDTPCGEVVNKDVCCFPTRVCELFPHDQVLKNLQAESYVGVTLKNHAGHPIGLIAVIGRRPLQSPQFAEIALKMISIRAASQLEQLQNELVLQASEKKYRELFESVPIGLYQSTMEGKIIAANQHCLDIAKCKKSERDAWFAQDTRKSYVHPEDSDRIRDLLLKKGYVDNFEADILLMDGSVATLSNTAKIIFNAKGEPDFIAGSFIDVTDRKRSEEEKAKLETQLQHSQKMEMVGRLAGGIAHDFNNMLTLILGHTEMAVELFDPSETVYADLQAIREAATRSADLTRQLLAFARKQIIMPEVLELNGLIEKMLPMLRRIIGENIKLVWIPNCKNSYLKIDPSQIDQIVVNLCVNARDAITDNGIITLETGHLLARDNSNPEEPCIDFVSLSVSDDGCGINHDNLDHIFEPFFTTKEQGKGTGLGLSTVYGIIKQNNGTIECWSEPEKGTTFTIHLPLYKAPQQAAESPAPEQSIHKGNQTILLVEDELAILKLCQLMLERNGYDVLAAETAADALKIAENYNGTIELLVTDVIMPEMNGSELSKKLIALRPNLKTLFMSGYTADIIAHNNVLESGVNFLKKPVTMKSLTQAVYNIFHPGLKPDKTQ